MRSRIFVEEAKVISTVHEKLPKITGGSLSESEGGIEFDLGKAA
jgi:hypothetical protein